VAVVVEYMSISDSDEAGEVVGAAAGDPDAGLRRPAKKASNMVFFSRFLGVVRSLRTWWAFRFGGVVSLRGVELGGNPKSKRRRKKKGSRNGGRKRERVGEII